MEAMIREAKGENEGNLHNYRAGVLCLEKAMVDGRNLASKFLCGFL
jgi:hypothetical protein